MKILHDICYVVFFCIKQSLYNLNIEEDYSNTIIIFTVLYLPHRQKRRSFNMSVVISVIGIIALILFLYLDYVLLWGDK